MSNAVGHREKQSRVAPGASYLQRRQELETYFDRTAAKTWERLTSDAPVSGIRATVRAGRDAMRNTLLDWLPDDLASAHVLDAGCGTGAFAVEAARRGARVTAVDLSATLVDIARDRTPGDVRKQITFKAGDMLSLIEGERFDHIVAMDSLIHYNAPDMSSMLARLSASASQSILFTFAPRTRLLAAMHRVGQWFPRGDRSPAIEPIAEPDLRHRMGSELRLHNWRPTNTHRVSNGFYISQAMKLVREQRHA